MTKQDIEKLKAISISAVANDLGLSVGRKGSTLLINCLWHADKHPSMVLYEKNGENHAHCFSCGKDASVIDMVMESQHWDFKSACEYLSRKHNLLLDSDKVGRYRPLVRTNLYTLDSHYVASSHSMRSQFMDWLRRTLGDTESVQQAYETYRLGATRDGGVIFWQIDQHGRVRSGKIMHYHPNGHRDQSPGRTNWVHALLRNLGKDWELSQCLFGEHLINTRPDAKIMIVESEKSAIVLSCLYPEHIWLASGGCKGLKEEKLVPLKGRSVIFFPDSQKYQSWKEVLSEIPCMSDIDYRISNALEKYPANTDLVDIILQEV